MERTSAPEGRVAAHDSSAGTTSCGFTATTSTSASAAAHAGLGTTRTAPKRVSSVKMEPFECGKDPVALPEGRFAIKFSTIAIFFIIFDIELLFVWPWATVFKALGWFGYTVMLLFLGVLMLGFLYIWQKRGLEWE